MIFVFDTETTGLPKNYNAPVTDLDNWPRVIMLAYNIYTESQTIVKSFSSLVKPDGWEVPDTDFHKKHGYSTEKCKKHGKSMVELLTEFIKDLSLCHTVVAHNLGYDRNVIGAEMLRYGFKVEAKPVFVDTMILGTNICKLPGKYGYKYPSLTELHEHFFGEGVKGAHDALSDVEACAKCFFKIMLK